MGSPPSISGSTSSVPGEPLRTSRKPATSVAAHKVSLGKRSLPTTSKVEPSSFGAARTYCLSHGSRTARIRSHPPGRSRRAFTRFPSTTNNVGGQAIFNRSTRSGRSCISILVTRNTSWSRRRCKTCARNPSTRRECHPSPNRRREAEARRHRWSRSSIWGVKRWSPLEGFCLRRGACARGAPGTTSSSARRARRAPGRGASESRSRRAGCRRRARRRGRECPRLV